MNLSRLTLIGSTLIFTALIIAAAQAQPATKPTATTKATVPVSSNPIVAARREVAEAQAEVSRATGDYNAAKAKAAEGIQQTPQWKQLDEAQAKEQAA